MSVTKDIEALLPHRKPFCVLNIVVSLEITAIHKKSEKKVRFLLFFTVKKFCLWYNGGRVMK